MKPLTALALSKKKCPKELKVPKVVWIEAQEECREPLEATLAKQGRDEDVVAITAISSEAGSAKLFRTDNSISTSLKPLGPGNRSQGRPLFFQSACE